MDNLKEALIKFRDITIELCASLEKGDYDSLDNIINRRQEVIEYIKTLNYKDSDFLEISTQLRVFDQQINLDRLIVEKRIELKSILGIVAGGRNAASNYVKKGYVDSMFFNKKI